MLKPEADFVAGIFYQTGFETGSACADAAGRTGVSPRIRALLCHASGESA